MWIKQPAESPGLRRDKIVGRGLSRHQTKNGKFSPKTEVAVSKANVCLIAVFCRIRQRLTWGDFKTPTPSNI
jgi:hypothetical protein